MKALFNKLPRKLKLALIAVLGLSSILLVSWVAICLTISRGGFDAQIKSLVNNQDIVEVQFDSISVSPFFSVSLSGVKVYEKQNRMQHAPIIEVDRLGIGVDLYKILILNLNVSELSLDGVRVKVVASETDKKNSITNLLSLIPESKTTDSSENKQQVEMTKERLSALISSLYLPIPVKVSINNVGISNLSLIYAKYAKSLNVDKETNPKVPLSKYAVDGINLNLDLSASMFGVKAGVFFGNQESIKLKITEKGQDVCALDFTQKLSLALDSEITLAMDNDSRVAGMCYGKKVREDILALKLRLGIRDDLSQILLDRLEVSILEDLVLSTGLKITQLDQDLKGMHLNNSLDLSVDLGEFYKKLVFYLPAIKNELDSMGGRVTIEDFAVEGNLSVTSFDRIKNMIFAELDNPTKSRRLQLKELIPEINSNIRISEIGLNSKKHGINIEGLNTDLKISILKDSNNHKLSVNESLNISALAVRSVDKKFNKVMGFSQTFEAIVDLTQLSLDALAVNLNIPTIETPLREGRLQNTKVEVVASTAPDIMGADIRVKTKIDDLLDLSATAICVKGCERINIEQRIEPINIETIIALADSLEDVHLPKIDAKGFVGQKIEAEFNAPWRGDDSFENIKSRASFSNKINFSVDQFFFKSENPSIDFADLDFEVSIQGSRFYQDVSIKNTFSQMQTSIKPGQYDDPVDVLLSNLVMGHRVRISNLDLIAKPTDFDNVHVRAGSEIGLGKIMPVGVLHSSIDNTKIGMNVELEGLKNLTKAQIIAKQESLGASAKAEINGKIDANNKPVDFSSNVEFQVQPPSAEIQTEKKFEMMGGLTVSANVVGERLDKLGAQASLNFDNFNFQTVIPGGKKVIISNLTGSIPIEHQIDAVSAGVNKKSNDLISSYVEERMAADNVLSGSQKSLQYDRLSFVDQNENPLRFKVVQFGDFEMGPFLFDAEMKNNEISINRLDLAILGGGISGRVFIPIDERGLIGVNSIVHFSKIDTNQLIAGLPARMQNDQSLLDSGDPYIDGVFKANYNNNSKMLSGGIDLTNIGADQLRALLRFIDPKGENDTLETIRKSLYIGSVKSVEIPIVENKMDMNVDVRLLGIPLPIPSLEGFPISSFVEGLVSAETLLADPVRAKNKKEERNNNNYDKKMSRYLNEKDNYEVNDTTSH